MPFNNEEEINAERKNGLYLIMNLELILILYLMS